MGTNKTITYAYDERNNLREKAEYAYTNAVGLENPTKTTSFGVGDWKDQITAVTVETAEATSTTNLCYDKFGRFSSTNGDVLIGWDKNGQLSFYRNGPQCYYSYKYDVDGNRIYSSSLSGDNVYYRYVDGKLVSQINYNSNNATTSEIDFVYNSTGIVGFYYNSAFYTYRKNLFGDIIAIYYGDTRVAKYAYDAFGNCTIVENNGDDIANINPFRYRGYYYDVETGLYYLKSRYYSPKLGRFISPDSIDSIKYLDPQDIHGLNLYTYCANNPIMYVDPTGHFFISALIIGAIIGATIGLGTTVYIDSQDDGEVFNGSVEWYDYLGATLLGGFIGAGLGAFAGMSFSASIPTFGWINSGGALMFGVTKITTIAVTGAQVLGVAGALVASGLLMFSKGNGPRMGHNQYENKQFNSLCNKYKLTKEQRRILHDHISGQNYSYHEIEQIIKELFFS